MICALLVSVVITGNALTPHAPRDYLKPTSR